MPTIICSYCQYVGNGQDYDDRITDVKNHEKSCLMQFADSLADDTHAAYEQVRDDGRINFNKKGEQK